jgi:hypothetical protein
MEQDPVIVMSRDFLFLGMYKSEFILARPKSSVLWSGRGFISRPIGRCRQELGHC